VLGLAVSLIVLALIPIVIGIVIIERRHGHPWLMRGQFGTAWYERHGGGATVPNEAFDAWLDEWRRTRIKAGPWLDRQRVGQNED
jgi:hypothetical protein